MFLAVYRKFWLLSLFLTNLAAATAGNNLNPPPPFDPTLYDESRRNQFHYSAPQGWHNDVNGPVYYNGIYHLFHQHHPTKATYYTWTGPMHWGHATSTDLVHWTIQPIALHPDATAANRLFSGGGIVDTNNTSGLKTGNDDIIALFTGTEDGIHMCYSTDGGQIFQDYLSISVPYVNVTVRRDPKVFWHEPTQKWIMVLYEEHRILGRSAGFYSSPNLLDWSHESSYANGLFECPDMYQLAVLNPDGSATGVSKWVLSDADFEYEVGDFDGHIFTSNMGGTKYKMESAATGFGNTYASLTYENTPGRRIQQSWMGHNIGGNEGKWNGCISFPLELKLVDYGADGIRITRQPVAEIASLYSESKSWSNQTITANVNSNPLKDTFALHFELIAEFDLNDCTADSFGLQMRTRNGDPGASVMYDKQAKTLNGHAMAADHNNRIRIRVLVDRDALDYFGNNGYISYQGNTFFKNSPYNQRMAVVASGGSVVLRRLEFNLLSRIWQGPVTFPPPAPEAESPVIIENTEALYSGVWHVHNDPIYNGGSCHFGNTVGGYFESSFVGTGVRWYGLKNLDLGFADVYIDGILKADDIDCFNSSRYVDLLYEIDELPFSEHTIKVVATGDKNPNSSNTFLVHDYFECCNQKLITVAIEDHQADYSGHWNTAEEGLYSGGACHYGNTTGGYFKHDFVGTRIRWYGLMNNDLGYANVYIDDVLTATNIDCYDGKRHVNLLYEKTDLPFGYHSIKVVVNGLKNPASVNTYLVHDYIKYSYPVGRADIVPDGNVNLKDFCRMAAFWCCTDCDQSNGHCLGTDINANGTVDMDDLAQLIIGWLNLH